ncbi:methyltransferase domain-containing protein [Salinarimonas sp. NSM]|uniref:methyltransferase domain-containing protein n=1 Tax=Salinarimonas sp. NSM TaxID=3458003 RepID=UPI0040359BA6
MSHPLDVSFSTDIHLRLLLRLDRGQAVQRAVERAVRPGDRVLDAGTGSGLLSYIALRCGAANVLAVDRTQVALARAIAAENGLTDAIEFVQCDLEDLDPGIAGAPFDTLLAFVYTNHIITDEARSRLVFALRERFATPTSRVVPNRVRYLARACDWPARDLAGEAQDLRNAVASLESTYGLRFQSLLQAALREFPVMSSRPSYHGAYPWRPGGSSASALFDRGGMRILSADTPFTTIAYEKPGSFSRYPDALRLEISAPGVCTSVVWTQQLLYDDILVWTTETVSPLAQARRVEPGEVLELAIDDEWRGTNVLR